MAGRAACFRLQRLSDQLDVLGVRAEQVDVVRAAVLQEQGKSGAASKPQVGGAGFALSITTRTLLVYRWPRSTTARSKKR